MFAYYLWSYLSLLASVVLLSAFFFILEALIPANKQPLSSRFFNLFYYPVILIAMMALNFILNPAYSKLLQITRGGLLPNLIAVPRTFVTQLMFALAFAVVWDIWQYWVHRWQHASPLLWQTHRFHHSETAFNSSVWARTHLSHHLLVGVLYFPVFIFFGLMYPHAIAAFMMFRMWGFVNHANVRLSFGIITPVIAGPQWHRIHHSTQAEHRDRNFATFFPFIDLVFGTYYAPHPNEYPATGLAAEESISNLRDATFEPVLGIYRIAKRQTRFGDGLRRMTSHADVDQVV
ncbi:MAG TPA: sterol desaturase family protein [Pyrinomonadaceae bacterium]|nr:sterol desaturase family protein [Pyrinomonadaceae bacterium]